MNTSPSDESPAPPPGSTDELTDAQLDSVVGGISPANTPIFSFRGRPVYYDADGNLQNYTGS